jgi:hypothetical protein
MPMVAAMKARWPKFAHPTLGQRLQQADGQHDESGRDHDNGVGEVHCLGFKFLFRWCHGGSG